MVPLALWGIASLLALASCSPDQAAGSCTPSLVTPRSGPCTRRDPASAPEGLKVYGRTQTQPTKTDACKTGHGNPKGGLSPSHGGGGGRGREGLQEMPRTRQRTETSQPVRGITTRAANTAAGTFLDTTGGRSSGLENDPTRQVHPSTPSNREETEAQRG